MSTLVGRIAPARVLYWPAVAGSLGLVAAGTGVAPVAPIVAATGLALLFAARLQTSAMAVLALAIVVDNPQERPMQNLWQSPLAAPGRLLYENLRNIVGVDALRFCALEVLIGLLLTVVLLRKLTRDPIDDPLGLGAVPNPMKMAFAAFAVVIVSLEVSGLARGGDFRNSLWQIRTLFWLPILGVVFGNAFKTAGARVGVLRTLMAAAWVRCLTGLIFYFAVCRPAGITPAYATTHSDSVLTVVAILIGLATLAERPSRDHLILNLVLQPVLLGGLVVNNRRLAFVSLAVGVATLVVTGPPAFRRFLKKSALAIVPAAAVYVAAGWSSPAGIFKPVAMIRSVSSQDDSSSQTRDIENFNLIQTLKQHPLLGSGFGHEYVEQVRANRVDQYFPQYRYVAHNSVLWILSISGWLGFSFLWALFSTALAIALRVYRRATAPVDRVTALAAAAAILCLALQAWGDMGLQSWLVALVVASLMGATGAIFTAQQQRCA